MASLLDALEGKSSSYSKVPKAPAALRVRITDDATKIMMEFTLPTDKSLMETMALAGDKMQLALERILKIKAIG